MVCSYALYVISSTIDYCSNSWASCTFCLQVKWYTAEFSDGYFWRFFWWFYWLL